MKHYTTISQSKKLLSLGLSPETSDMIYSMVNGRSTPFIRLEKINELDELHDVPCWSVGALIKLLPHDIVYQTKLFEPTHCMLNLSKTGVGYSSSIDRYPDRSFNQCWMENPDLVDALYNCMVWLLENNYLKTEK